MLAPPLAGTLTLPLRTGKTVLLITLVAVVALVVTGVLMRDRFIEQWFLKQLDSKDTAVRDRAAAKLASLGAVDAIPKLLTLIRRETTFETKTVLRPGQPNARGIAPPVGPVGVTPGGTAIGRTPGGSKPTPSSKNASEPAATVTLSYARQNYTVVSQSNGPWTMTYGSDVFCFEAPELCLDLIDLVQTVGARAVPHLRRALDHDDLHIRYLAAAMISVLRERAQELYPLLREIVLDEEVVADMNRPDYRTEASEAMPLVVGDNVEHLVPMFIDMILTWNESLQVAGHKGLLRAGEAAVPFLVERLKENKADLEKSNILIEAIARQGDAAKPAVPAIVDLLAVHDRETRLFAIQALFWLGTTAAAAIPELEKLLITDEDETMQEWAAQALGEIRGRQQQARSPVIPPNLLPPKPIDRGSADPSEPPVDPPTDN